MVIPAEAARAGVQNLPLILPTTSLSGTATWRPHKERKLNFNHHTNWSSARGPPPIPDFRGYVIWWFTQNQTDRHGLVGRPRTRPISIPVPDRTQSRTPLNPSKISRSQQPPAASQSPALKTYRVSLGPPQRKEAGEEELAPADDGSQAPVEASHACFLPVLSASLSAPGLDPATHPPPHPSPREEKKEEADWSWSDEPKPSVKSDGEIYLPLFSRFCVCNSSSWCPADGRDPWTAQGDPKTASFSFHQSPPSPLFPQTR